MSSFNTNSQSIAVGGTIGDPTNGFASTLLTFKATDVKGRNGSSDVNVGGAATFSYKFDDAVFHNSGSWSNQLNVGIVSSVSAAMTDFSNDGTLTLSQTNNLTARFRQLIGNGPTALDINAAWGETSSPINQANNNSVAMDYSVNLSATTPLFGNNKIKVIGSAGVSGIAGSESVDTFSQTTTAGINWQATPYLQIGVTGSYKNTWKDSSFGSTWEATFKLMFQVPPPRNPNPTPLP
jgi:hypothetical protein